MELPAARRPRLMLAATWEKRRERLAGEKGRRPYYVMTVPRENHPARASNNSAFVRWQLQTSQRAAAQTSSGKELADYDSDGRERMRMARNGVVLGIGSEHGRTARRPDFRQQQQFVMASIQ